MSGTGEVSADFAGEERQFRIRLGEIRRIEAASKDAIGDVLQRLARCVYVIAQHPGLEALAAGVSIKADDVREVIYQGLIGARMSAQDATSLVRRAIDDHGIRGLLDNADVALTILWGAQRAPDEDGEPGEAHAGEDPATTSASTSPPSTAPEPPSASARARSTNSRSGNSTPASKAGNPPTAEVTRPRRTRRPKSTKS